MIRRRAALLHLTHEPAACIPDKCIALRRPERPQVAVTDLLNRGTQLIESSKPALFSTGTRPEGIRFLRLPGRNVHAIGHMTNRDFVLRPIRKKRLKDSPTDRRVQETD